MAFHVLILFDFFVFDIFPGKSDNHGVICAI